MKSIFSVAPIWQHKAMGIVRIILGLLILYHGQELFHAEIMNEYFSWEIFSSPVGKVMVYIGKIFELIAGISLTFGVLTRVGAMLIIGNLTFITFFVGSGRFWYEDQHPFLFVLLGIIYFFNGPGAWSLDNLIFPKKNG